MSRMNTGDTVIVKPTNNVYTVLAGVATVVVVLALVAVYVRGQAIGVFGGH